MTKIYETSKEMYIARHVIYPKGDVAYKDVVCDTPFTNKELKEAFLRDGIVDIAAGTYGDNPRALIVPSTYEEGTDGTSAISFCVPKIEGEKNQYPIYADEDFNNIKSGYIGQPMYADPFNHSIVLTDIPSNHETILYYKEPSALYSTIKKLSNQVVTVSVRIDVVRNNPDDQLTFTLDIGNQSFWRYVTPEEDHVILYVTGYDLLNALNPTVQVTVKHWNAVPKEFSISQIQIEYGRSYTEYEPFTPKEIFEPYVAHAINP